MSMIANLTQHPVSEEQKAAGVVDLPSSALSSLRAALTFENLPNEQEIRRRVRFIAHLISGDSVVANNFRADKAMIGGALWLMAPLAAELRARGIEPLFAFSVRETEEQKQADGSVRKVTVFRHTGFVPAVAL